MNPLEAWGNFYVIVGSSAGAMTGLQFVVMTLIAQSGPTRARGETISAFGTPNVVHFCSALLVSAILSVPWSSMRLAGLTLTVCGVLGTLYSLIVFQRARRQSGYEPVLEDWIWHNILPLLAYATLLVSGLTLERGSAGALLATGAATLLLVFIGIHNAWDTVTYLMMRETGEPAPPERSAAPAPTSVPATPVPAPAPAATAPAGGKAGETPTETPAR